MERNGNKLNTQLKHKLVGECGDSLHVQTIESESGQQPAREQSSPAHRQPLLFKTRKTRAAGLPMFQVKEKSMFLYKSFFLLSYPACSPWPISQGHKRLASNPRSVFITLRTNIMVKRMGFSCPSLRTFCSQQGNQNYSRSLLRESNHCQESWTQEIFLSRYYSSKYQLFPLKEFICYLNQNWSLLPLSLQPGILQVFLWLVQPRSSS